MHPRKVKGVRKRESNQKRFYDRETIATLNYEIQPKPFILLFPFPTKKITLLLIEGSQLIIIQGMDFQTSNGEIPIIKGIVCLL